MEQKKLCFVESIYIPYGTNTACVTLFPVNEVGEEEQPIIVETTTDKLVYADTGEEVVEGDYCYYDSAAAEAFTDGNNDPIAEQNFQQFAELQGELINRSI